jgi:hypothetical protein
MNYCNIKNINCCAIDYCVHILDITIPLLTNPAYFSDRDNIRDHSAKTLLAVVRYHRKLFDSLEYRYRIGERLTLYCKKFNVTVDPKEYCIKI